MNYEKDGFVSIWVGTTETANSFESLMHETYDDDDGPISIFGRLYGIDWYDHDFLEAHLEKDGITPIRGLLEAISFSTSFIEEACRTADKRLPTAAGNVVVCLFDFDYTGARSNISHQSVQLDFLGSFSYDNTAESVREPET